MTALALSRLHFPVTTLGPGRRIGLWMQGCSIRCAGCVSMDTWAPNDGMTSVAATLAALREWLPDADGLTVSGGEPFDQPLGLRALLEGVRSESAIDVLVYSGYPIETIAQEIGAMDGLIDALISDPYDETQPQALPLRGSDNQRLHLLTPLGQARFAHLDTPAPNDAARFDIMIDADGSAWLAGIPRHEDMARLRDLLRDLGHEASLSAHRHPVARVE